VARPFLRSPVSQPIFPLQLSVLVLGALSEKPAPFDVGDWLPEAQALAYQRIKLCPDGERVLQQGSLPP